MNLKFAAVASIALVSGIASADLLINGSFESPDVKGGWGAFPNDKVGGWFAEQGTMEVGAASVYGVTGQTGNQVLELDSAGNAKISQNVNTTAGLYTLTFDAALRNHVAAKLRHLRRSLEQCHRRQHLANHDQHEVVQLHPAGNRWNGQALVPWNR